MTRLSVSLTAIACATLAICAAGCQATAASDAVPLAELAIDALAADLKIPKERITVESVTAIDWRDSSLGCPKPDMAYLEVITPGHKVLLNADGALYAVHEAKGRVFVCHQPKLKAGLAAPGGQLAYGQQMMTAQRDLADRLGVSVREIRPAGAVKRIWDDASIGCPEPGVQYAQVVTEGWALRFRHGEREYTYHADANRAIPCPAIATR